MTPNDAAGAQRDPTRRFSARAEAYAAFRPGYPSALLDRLFAATGLAAGAAVADVGAGTGIFSRLLLRRGLRVFAVEPNADMRAAAAASLDDETNFTAVDAAAEATGLGTASVELVTAAQAFHWFANADALAEFGRILQPGGRLALIWNRRDLAQPFQRAYADLLHRYVDDNAGDHRRFDATTLAPFFAAGRMETYRCAHTQPLDLAGLLGRLRSASYCPPVDGARYRELARALERLFAEHARGGQVDFGYEASLYLGEVAR